MNKQSKPPVVLLAGGKNSRFFPLDTGTHKSCRPVAGKPLVVWVIEDLAQHGFTDVILVVSKKDYQGQGISKQLDEFDLPVNLEYVLQQEPKGQANAILTARKKLNPDFDHCIVASPYYLKLGSLANQLLTQQQQNQAECVLLGSETQTPELYGILTTQETRVTGIEEKPNTTTVGSQIKINSVYLLNAAFLEFLAAAPESEYSLEQALDKYAQDHLIEWAATKNELSLKFSWQLLNFMAEILPEQHSYQHPSANIAKTAIIDETDGPVVIEESAVIKDFAKISGPAYIGKYAFVGEFCFVRRSSLESRVVVGAHTEVARSLLLPDSTIHQSYLADSILGDHSWVAANLTTANKRFDRAPLKITVQNKQYEVESNRLGIITGERSKIGISVNTMPGTLIGSDSTIFPGQTVYKAVPAESQLKPTTETKK